MVHQQLVDYIKREKNKGKTEQQIRALLRENSFKDEDVSDAFSVLSTPVSVPKTAPSAPSASLSPKPTQPATQPAVKTPPLIINQSKPQSRPQMQPKPQILPKPQPQSQIKPQFQPQSQPQIKTQVMQGNMNSSAIVSETPGFGILLVGLVAVVISLAGNFLYWKTTTGNLDITLLITGCVAAFCLANLLAVWLFTAIFRVNNNYFSKALIFAGVFGLLSLFFEFTRLPNLSASQMSVISVLVFLISVIVPIVLLVKLYNISAFRSIGIYICSSIVTVIISGIILMVLLFTGLISLSNIINFSLQKIQPTVSQNSTLTQVPTQTPTQVQSQPQVQPPVQSVAPTQKTNEIVVDGMKQYTDSDFGFSFWYPAGWLIQMAPVNQYISLSGGTVVKTIVLGPAGDSSNSIAIQEFKSSDTSITDSSPASPAGNGSLSLTYYFDQLNHVWMAKDVDSGNIATTLTADVSINTMGGLHLLAGNARFTDDFIVPISARNFVVVSSVEAGTIREKLLADTIVATNPKVANPESPADQMTTIHTEGLLYGAVGTPVSNWGYKDGKYVYDSLGNIMFGANPSTFRAINTYSDGSASPTGFATDGISIYYYGLNGGEVLKGVDPTTFVVIRKCFIVCNTRYEKDKSSVWDFDKIIPGADPKTFTVTSDGWIRNSDGGVTLARDANHVYGEDPNGNVTIDGAAIQ